MKHQVQILRTLFVALVICFSLTSTVLAQDVSGSVTGTVVDAAGAAVAGATVTVTDTGTKIVVRTLTTGEDGRFDVPNLLSATYEISVEAPGFKKRVQANLKIDVGQRRSVELSLEAGNISETVTVESAPVTIQTTTAANTTVINGDQVRQLSINNRNFIQLVALAPGVTNDLDDYMPTGTNNPDTQVVVRSLISVNGARNTSNTFTIDGADITDRGSNLTIQAYPSVDSIGEFQVLRSLYPADSGRSTGGQINIVTKGGANQFHGSAFEFVRNHIFNANDFASNRTPSLAAIFGREANGKIKRKPFHYNNFGFTIGGPIYFTKFGQDGDWFGKVPRTFFFFSEEERRDIRYPLIQNGVVPTAAMKSGVFPIDICISATAAGSANCTQTLAAGAPLSTLSPISNVAQQYVTRIWNNVPTPTKTNLGLDFPALNITSFSQQIVRLDHTTDNNRWNFFYRFENDKIPTTDADGTIGTRSGLPFVNTTASRSPGRTHTFQVTYTPNANMVAEARYTYGYGAIYIDTIGLISKATSPISVNLPYLNARDVNPQVAISGYSSLTGFGNYIDPSSKGNLAGNMTVIHGNHSFKFGVLLSRNTKTENALSGTNQGAFSVFSNTVNSNTSPACVLPTTSPTSAVNTLYQNFACFLMGKNVTFTQSKLDLMIDFRQKSVEWYAQDEYKFRKNITLNFGVRYSYFAPPWDKNGFLTNFLPSLWNPANAPIVTGDATRRPGTGNFCNGLIVNSQNYQTGPAAFNCTPTSSPFGKYIYQASKHDFAPRVGIAWDPFKKGTTSVRAGIGMYHDQISLSAAELLSLNPPYQETATQVRTTMDQPIPIGLPIPVVASGTPASIRAIQSNFLTPYVTQWSFDVQHQIGNKTIFTLGYYASKGTHLNGNTEYNDLAVNKALTTTCATLATALQDPAPTTAPCMVAGTAFTAAPAILDQIRPYRGYRSINILETRYNSNYHSLQFFGQRRFSGASQVNIAYTWSKNLTDNQTSSVNAAPQDSNNVRAEYGRALLDRKHVFSANYIYELPFFKDQKGLAGKLFGGWQSSGIVTLQSGLPFTVAYSSYDPSGFGYIPAIVAGGRPLLLCDPNSGGARTVDQWFNPACFSAQTVAGATGVNNAVGNAPRGIVDGPPTKRVDFTMAKNLRFGENVAVQLRAEAFNVFNHTNFRALSVSRAITNTTFGAVTTFRDPRVLQFGLKIGF